MCIKQFTYTERIKIEEWYKLGISKKEMANYLKVNLTTIYRELNKGYYNKLNSDYTYVLRYSADIAQKKTNYLATSKGANLKVAKDKEFINFVENKIINEHYSPYAVLTYIENHNLKFKTKICKATLYNYIYKGIFLKLRKKHLPQKGKRKPYKKVEHINLKNPLALSIEERPIDVLLRDTFVHWEQDCVIGTKEKSAVFLVLTERKTRYELIFKMKDKSANSVVKVWDMLERKCGKHFKHIFKTLTNDNGGEFANTFGMQRSCKDPNKQRIIVYYCHPYSSCERGSNENQNKFIRRYYPKGKSLQNVKNVDVYNLQNWLNNYPRFMFNGKCSADLLKQEFAQMNIQFTF